MEILILQLQITAMRIKLWFTRISLRVGQFMRKEKPLTNKDIQLIGWLCSHSGILDSYARRIDSGELSSEEALQQCQEYYDRTGGHHNV